MWLVMVVFRFCRLPLVFFVGLKMVEVGFAAVSIDNYFLHFFFEIDNGLKGGLLCFCYF